MKTLFAACFIAVASVSAFSVAHAQATRTWVSGVGDDANPCSRTAPCKTFAGAISKTATGGYIDALDPGGFGAVTITKSITIDGGGSLAGILASGTNGINVTSGAAKVILRNLSIEGAGTGLNGINVLNAAVVHVENCTIQNFTQNGIFRNTAAAGGALFVTDTTIKEVTGQGIYIQSGPAALNRVTLNQNGTGLLAGQSAIVSVKNSVASHGETGFGAAYTSASQLNIENSHSTHNRYGILATGGATVRLSNVSIFNNTTTGLFNDGTGQIISFGNNRLAGNAVNGAFTSSIAEQ